MKFLKAMKNHGFDYEETVDVLNTLMCYTITYKRNWKHELRDHFRMSYYPLLGDTPCREAMFTESARGLLQAVRNELYDEVMKLTAPQILRLWHFNTEKNWNSL